MSQLPPGKSKGLSDRTMMVQAPTFNRAGRAWRDFAFTGLEKVSKAQVLLTQRLEWLLPGVAGSGSVSEGVRTRLGQLFDEEVRLVVDYLHVTSPKGLKKYLADPTFLAVMAPLPHKNRGFLEVELGLAHAAIDLLLGGAGETVSLRPLTDIEQGVMSYLLIETLKAISPSVDPGLPRLRLEGLVQGVDEAISLLGEESQVAVVQLKAVIGAHSGYLRLFIPASVLGMTQPPSEGPERRARRSALLQSNAGRLSAVRTWLRAEIGYAEISSNDLSELRDRDVVLVDHLSARPDRGEGGLARLKIGAGRIGRAEAEVLIEDGRYQARITGFFFGEEPRQAGREPDEEGAGMEAPENPDGAGEEVDGPEQAEGAAAEDSTNPHAMLPGGEYMDESDKSEAAELLTDIPLQIAIELARVPVSAEEVVSLKVGQVIDLNRMPGEPVELSVNGKVVARGELVEVEGNLGVRVLSLAG